MIEKILNKLGYYKAKDINNNSYTEQEIHYLFSSLIGNVFETSFPKEDEMRLFTELSAVEGFKEYLKHTNAKDIQRYFAAHNDTKTQDLVRGAMARNTFFLSMLKDKDVNKSTKLSNLRYSK